MLNIFTWTGSRKQILHLKKWSVEKVALLETQGRKRKWQSGKRNGIVPLYKQNLLSDVPTDETAFIVESEKGCDIMIDKLHSGRFLHRTVREKATQ